MITAVCVALLLGGFGLAAWGITHMKEDFSFEAFFGGCILMMASAGGMMLVRHLG